MCSRISSCELEAQHNMNAAHCCGAPKYSKFKEARRHIGWKGPPLALPPAPTPPHPRPHPTPTHHEQVQLFHLSPLIVHQPVEPEVERFVNLVDPLPRVV